MSNDPISHEISSGDRPRRQDTTLGGADAQTRPEIALKCAVIPPLSEVNTSGCGEDNMEYHDDLMDFVPPTSYDSPLSGGNTPGSDEGRMELIQELMETLNCVRQRVGGERGGSTADQVILLDQNNYSSKFLSAIHKSSTLTNVTSNHYSFSHILNHSLPAIHSGVVSPLATRKVIEQVAVRSGMDSKVAELAQTPLEEEMKKPKEKKKELFSYMNKELPNLNRSTKTLQPLPTIDPKDKELAQRLHEKELAKLDRAQKERQKQEEH
ncbi:hypothetical protein Tco_1005115 [Tanacetum coccineum]|uniref:Uncharacterized protein n=1 Tax=Tanacetum coccineum TaxID=301880 RepID=A0ABQ5FG94_9ASTR